MRVDVNAFMTSGGTELAAVSTSRSKAVALEYAASRAPFIFKLRTSGLTRGSSVGFLSVHPTEEEFLVTAPGLNAQLYA